MVHVPIRFRLRSDEPVNAAHDVSRRDDSLDNTLLYDDEASSDENDDASSPSSGPSSPDAQPKSDSR